MTEKQNVGQGKKATMKDVAREANVSLSTVSYVLNHVKSVKPKTHQRIMDAVDKLNYQQSMVAKSLKTKQTKTIGIIVPEISNFFFTEVVRGIEDIAYENDFSIILCNTNENADKEKRYLDVLMSKNIDGLIFISTGQNKNILENYREVPIVIVDRKLGDLASMVLVDNVQGGYLATSYLLEKRGYPIYFLSGPITISTYYDRLNGYVKALNEKNYDFHDEFVYQCSIDIKSGHQTMKEIIRNHPGIHSVFAANDIIALGAMKAIGECDLVLGKDIFLVGYDDIDTASYVTPALTTVRQPKYVMGTEAMQILLESIQQKLNLGKKVTLQPELIIRETA